MAKDCANKEWASKHSDGCHAPLRTLEILDGKIDTLKKQNARLYGHIEYIRDRLREYEGPYGLPKMRNNT